MHAKLSKRKRHRLYRCQSYTLLISSDCFIDGENRITAFVKLKLTTSFLCFVQSAGKFSGYYIASHNFIVAAFDFFKRKRIVCSLSHEKPEANTFVLFCRPHKNLSISVKEDFREKVANGGIKAQPAALFVHSNNRLF